jgi:transposase
MRGFRKVEVPREQLILWSYSLEDAIAVEHPVRLFDQLLRSAALEPVFRDWRREYVLVEGRPPFDPRDLTGLYLYGMLHRLRSSRQLEAACHNRLDVIWLMSGQKPDHSTIAGFAAKHASHLKKLFRQTIRVAMDAGLVKLEHAAVDGTKLEADAGRNSVRSQATLEAQRQQVQAQIQQVEAAAVALENEWAQNEARESNLWAEQAPPAAPANAEEAALRLEQFRRKQQKLQAALAAIAKREQEAQASGGKTPKAIASSTDPDARVMPDKQGKSRPGYNAQLAVDAQAGVVVAADLNDRPEDLGQLTPMLQQVQENCGKLPAECSADSGYSTGPDLAKLAELQVIGYLPDAGTNSAAAREDRPLSEAASRQARALQAAHAGQTLSPEQWEALPRTGGQIDKGAFTYDAQRNAYRCPAGVMLPVLRHSADHKSGGMVHRTQYGGSPACASCAHAAGCCKNPHNGRTVNRDQYEPLREQMRQRMQSEEGRRRYRLRAQTVEPRFGVIKSALGIRRLLRRGLEKARSEFALICSALNIQVLLREWPATAAVLKTS